MFRPLLRSALHIPLVYWALIGIGLAIYASGLAIVMLYALTDVL